MYFELNSKYFIFVGMLFLLRFLMITLKITTQVNVNNISLQVSDFEGL